MTSEEGALLEPLAVAVHPCRRAGIKPGSSCTVIGAGAVGLLCAVAARLSGCSRIVIADIVPSRVEFALHYRFADAGFVVPAKRGATAEEELEIAREMAKFLAEVRYPDGTTVGRSNYTFKCTGVQSCVQASILVSTTISTLRDVQDLTLHRLQRQEAKRCWSAWVLPIICFQSRVQVLVKWISLQSGVTQTATPKQSTSCKRASLMR